MDTGLLRTARPLPRNALQHVAARPGRRIEVVSGCVWLTIDRDPRDIVLAAGEGYTLTGRDRDAIVSALEPSTYLLLDEQVAA